MCRVRRLGYTLTPLLLPTWHGSAWGHAPGLHPHPLVPAHLTWQARGGMRLGYTVPGSAEFKAASTVQLRNTMRVDDDEAVRKACWQVRGDL